MWELGEYARQAHVETGRWVQERGVELLFLLGEFATHVAQGATERGMDPSTIFIGKNQQELIHHLARSLKKGDWVLIKGSRMMKMEGIIEALKEKL
jgi:UDP-N-acetylmuramoyl-tripeptide--D-alanyl-D-alanine ligase